jgi:arylsulfatase A-like enzyme
LYWEFPGKGGKQAILQNEWKLVSTKVNSSTPKYELFNLTKDPKETNNLVNDEKDIFEKTENINEFCSC